MQVHFAALCFPSELLVDFGAKGFIILTVTLLQQSVPVREGALASGTVKWLRFSEPTEGDQCLQNPQPSTVARKILIKPGLKTYVYYTKSTDE